VRAFLKAPEVVLGGAQPRHASNEPSTVEGDVRSSDGAVLGQASVCWADHPSTCCALERCTLTDDTGHFSLDVEPSAATLVASASGYLSHVVGVAAGAIPTSVTFVLSSAHAGVSGIVLDASGGALVEALVSARAGAGGEVVATARSDADGYFALGVAPGRIELTARTEGYAEARHTALLAPAGGVRLVLAPASVISGRVVVEHTGEPVAGARVSASNRNGLRAQVAPVLSDEDGGFRLDSLPAGGYELYASGARWRSKPSWVNVGVGQSSESVLLGVAAATTLSATVQVGGEPCLDGRLAAAGPTPSHARLARGTAHLEGLVPGHYRIDIRCAPGIPHSEVLEVGAGPVSRRWDLQVGLALRGRVESAGGRPLPNVSVGVTPVQPGRPGASCLTDAAGEFECTGLSEGEHDCRTQTLEQGNDVARVSLSESSPPPHVVLRGNASGRIEVSVSRTAKAHEVPWRVFARRGDQIPLVARPEAEVFVFERIPLGTYQLYLGSSAAHNSTAVSLTRDAQIERVTLAAPALGSIAGRIIDSQGAPVVDAWVRATVGDPLLSGDYAAGAPALTDDAGEFTVSSLPEGRYDLWVSSTSGDTSRTGVESGADDIVIRLDAYGSISGTVQTPTGEPVAAFSIARQADGGQIDTLLGENGAWSLPWLAPGKYTIVARSVAGMASREVVLGAGARLTLALIVEPPNGSPSLASSANPADDALFGALPTANRRASTDD
jgi:hypothetical protein